MPYINTIDINGVIYTLENLTDGNNIVTLPTLSRDDVFVLRGNIVNNTSSTSTTQPLSANQGKVLRDALNAEIQNRTNDVNLEEERATEAERVLTENLNKEITNRTNDVDAEETRATNAENTLTTNLNAEITRAKKAEADELARAQAAEKVLADNLAKEVSDRTNDVNSEEARALAAEKVLTDNLSAEVARATNKENEINTALANEISRATSAESTLTSNLNSEITRAKAAESANSTAISTEKSRAEGVESGLASRIATMEAFFKEADIDASQDFIDTLKEIQSYIESDTTGAAAMTASIQANKTAIETEKSRAEGVEGTLQDDLDALDRKMAELQETLVDGNEPSFTTIYIQSEDANSGALIVPADNVTTEEHQLAVLHFDGVHGDESVILRHIECVESWDAANKGYVDGLVSDIDERISTLEAPADYIIEQGTSGSWTYRKWNSGVSECWGVLTGTASPSDVDSNIAGFSVFDVSWNFPDDLFISTPNVTYNCNIGDGFSFPAQNTSSAKIFSCTALSTETNSNVAFKISAKASGMWK